jgi:deazaflavin-dependent oxidoreductase (nitroreductase family)
MDDRIRHALDKGQLIDITTIGRRSGQPRRIPIVFHNLEGRIYISGMPHHAKRDWLANLEADPALTFHLKGTVSADLDATARIVGEGPERRRIMALVAGVWKRTDVDEMVAWSPLIEVIIPGYAEATPA